MNFGSKFVYTPENDADEVEVVEEEEEETIDDVHRRHQASRDDGQVIKARDCKQNHQQTALIGKLVAKFMLLCGSRVGRARDAAVCIN